MPQCWVRYGCTELMRHEDINSHIEHCPASNVVCYFSHQRIEPNHQESSNLPYISSISGEDELIDQKFLEGDLNVWRTENLQVIENTEKENESQKWVEKIGEEIDKSFASSPPKLSLECHAGLLANRLWVAKRQFTLRMLNLRRRACIDTRTTDNFGYITGRMFSQNHRCCDFTCGEVVRRDEFSSHWKTLHLDIQLTDLVRRCPMHTYGCQYGVLDVAPQLKGSVLDYDRETDCFLYKPPSVVVTQETTIDTSSSQYAAEIPKRQELALYGYEDVEEESFDVLGQLPAEVLMVICGFLDSQSLWALSQVNHYLRKVCLNLVKEAGMVYWYWERDRSGSWMQGPMVCTLCLCDAYITQACSIVCYRFGHFPKHLEGFLPGVTLMSRQ